MELQVKIRTVLGKKVKNLRGEGLVPGEIFGHGFENKHVSVPAKDFEKIYREAGKNTIVTLINEEKEKTPVLISSVERDHISGKFLAVDFYHVRKDEKIHTGVPIVYVGTDAAAKAGYLLVKVLEQVEIEALPDAIPASFTVDVSELAELGQNKEVRDLPVEKGVKILTPEDTVIVTVTEKAKEEVVVPPPVAETTEEAAAAGAKETTEKTAA